MEPDDLVQRCLAGDQAAWSALIDRYAGLVYAIARAHRLDEAACDDVAQTVFTALVRELGEIREARALPGWISTAARRECWRVHRPRRGREFHRDARPDEPDEPLQRLQDLETVQRLRDGLAELGGRCQQLLTALFLADVEVDYQTLSRTLGIPIGSIGPSRARCLAKLARILEP